jgi:hypothetical protein
MKGGGETSKKFDDPSKLLFVPKKVFDIGNIRIENRKFHFCKGSLKAC